MSNRYKSGIPRISSTVTICDNVTVTNVTALHTHTASWWRLLRCMIRLHAWLAALGERGRSGRAASTNHQFSDDFAACTRGLNLFLYRACLGHDRGGL